MKKIIYNIQFHFNNLSIRSKLIVLLLVASIIPLLVVSTYGYISAQNRVKAQAEESLQVTNQHLKNHIESITSPIEQISSMLYTDTDLQEQLCYQYQSDIEYIEAYNALSGRLYSILASNGNIARITIYTDNRTISSDGLFIRHFDETFPFSDDQRDERNSITYCTTGKGKKDDMQILWGRTLNHSTFSDSYGFLTIAVREYSFSSIYSGMSSGYIYIFDQNGCILSSNDKASIASNIDEYLQITFSASKNEPFSASVNNESCMVICDSVSNGWQTLIAVPIHDVYGVVTSVTVQTLLIFGLCILASLLLIVQISHYFSSRFSLLMWQVNKIEQNDFSMFPVTSSNDEIGKLAAALNKMSMTLDQAINDVYLKEIQRKETELQLLQSQINPHLLYNSLSAISSMALKAKNTDISTFSNHLSQFYRLSLSRGQQYIPLQKEISITKHYIAIQQTRFRDMFSFTWDVDESIFGYITPKLILQPFVENIINHAVRDSEEIVHVHISIQSHGGNILCIIQDDGIGISADILAIILDPQKANGYGLINVNQRIKLFFGDSYGIHIESSHESGTTATVTIPKTNFPGGIICQSQ